MMSWIRESNQQNKTVGGVEQGNFSDEEVPFVSYMNAIPGANQGKKTKNFRPEQQTTIQLFSLGVNFLSLVNTISQKGRWEVNAAHGFCCFQRCLIHKA